MINEKIDRSVNNFKSMSQTTLLDAKKHFKKQKILVLGAPGVGKSAVIMRFKDDIFLDYYDPTIQATYKKNLQFYNENIELELIDHDGQTEYTIFSFSKFSNGINGYILCYSIENRQSFEIIKIIHSKLVTLVGRDFPKILVGNKCDLNNKREISFDEGKSLANIMNCSFIECSAKSSDNINKLFHLILLDIKKSENSADFRKINCKKLFKCFIKKEYNYKVLFYLLMSINIVNNVLLSLLA